MAAVLFELGAALRIVELTVPDLQPGQVLVDVAYSGVCHSQLNEVRGRRGPDRFLPHAVGHEGSGTVAAIGAGVEKVAVGERVVMSWIRGSGAEVAGATYQYEGIAVNAGAITTFMQRAVVSENRLTPLPPAVPLREAALLGCAIPTGAGIVVNTLALGRGDSVVVFGAGGIGVSAIMAAAALGANPIIAVDISTSKLEAARSFGATHTVDARECDPVAAVRTICGAQGADFAIEAAGVVTAMEQSLASVRAGGGVAALAGNVAVGERISIDPFDLIKGRRLVGSWGGETNPDRDIPRYAQMYAAGRLPLERMISKTYTLAQVNDALADLEAGRVVRALLSTMN